MKCIKKLKCFVINKNLTRFYGQLKRGDSLKKCHFKNSKDKFNRSLKKLNKKQVLNLYRQLKGEREEFKIYMSDDEFDENSLKMLTEQLRSVKDELNTREKLPTKAEKKKIRQQKAKSGKR